MQWKSLAVASLFFIIANLTVGCQRPLETPAGRSPPIQGVALRVACPAATPAEVVR